MDERTMPLADLSSGINTIPAVLNEEMKKDKEMLAKTLRQAGYWYASAIDELHDHESFAENLEVKNKRFALPKITPPALRGVPPLPRPSFALNESNNHKPQEDEHK